MITCKLMSRTPSVAVLDVEWMSLLLFHLLHPDPEILLDEGVLSQRLLFEKWMHEGLLADEDLCRAFLRCLSELHVSLEEHSERFAEAVVLVPHVMRDEVPVAMQDAVHGCRQFPHGGWRARPLQGELSSEGFFLLYQSLSSPFPLPCCL